MTSSYQNRIRDIKYLEQCIEELEEIALELASIIRKNGLKVPLLGAGITGDKFLTYYNSAEFSTKLMLG